MYLPGPYAPGSDATQVFLRAEMGILFLQVVMFLSLSAVGASPALAFGAALLPSIRYSFKYADSLEEREWAVLVALSLVLGFILGGIPWALGLYLFVAFVLALGGASEFGFWTLMLVYTLETAAFFGSIALRSWVPGLAGLVLLLGWMLWARVADRGELTHIY